eukprot:jgi/Botrbrau1/13603/Bobra.0069s0001.2
MTPTWATSCKCPAGLPRKFAQHENAAAFVIFFIGAGAATSDLTGPFQSPQTAPILEWGAAISAFQAEGGVNKGGRGTSIWEPFAKLPFRVLDGSNADVTSNFYEKYREDVGIMKQLGLQNFRFSVAWPRIYPQGSGQVNHEGLAFYHDLLDALIEAGITPHVTLYHWDLPQALQDKYGGWTNTSAIVRDFVNYVGTVVESFGDKVQYYATINDVVQGKACDKGQRVRWCRTLHHLCTRPWPGHPGSRHRGEVLPMCVLGAQSARGCRQTHQST